jgi:hypothetical protein
MIGNKALKVLFLLYGASLALGRPSVWAAEERDFLSIGPLYQKFGLTLEAGHRNELLGPLFYHQNSISLSNRIWAAPPVFSYDLRTDVDAAQFDFLYPLVTYDRYGKEYRFQILQWLSFAGGESMQHDTNVDRFTLFPLYFQERSTIPDRNYTAFFPIYGHLKNRFFRDESFFVVWPLFIESRKKDVVTDNFIYPFFHWRKGEGLRGWQFWPLLGREKKTITYSTNHWGDVQLTGGHKKLFAFWPLFFVQTTGIGTTNRERRHLFLPFYSVQRSPLRDSTSIPWPLGFTYTDDRGQKYKEWDFPWPLIEFARGEGKTVNRILPLFSRAHSPILEQNSYLWPVYKYRRVTSEPLDRERTRILFFLYSNVNERNTETGASRHRNDLWPLFTSRHDSQGNRQLQILAPLEPFLPQAKGIERNYSHLWSLWRSEKNGVTGATSQSLLWNLYRHDASKQFKKFSLLFGLFQYQTTPEGSLARLFYIPLGKRPHPEKGPPANSE